MFNTNIFCHLAEKEESHNRTNIWLHVFTGDGAASEGVDVERDEESVEEVVGQDSVEGVDVQHEDVIDVVEVVQVLSHHILQTDM